jgi:hypothetical protein
MRAWERILNHLILALRDDYRSTAEYKKLPFIQRVYLPSCALVGPRHSLVSKENGAWKAQDEHSYEDRDVTDDEFIELFKQGQIANRTVNSKPVRRTGQ